MSLASFLAFARGVARRNGAEPVDEAGDHRAYLEALADEARAGRL
jgi:hypothetical protein